VAHNRVEGNIEYTSLCTCRSARRSICSSAAARRIQLYVKRVFVMDKAAELLALAAFHAGSRR